MSLIVKNLISSIKYKPIIRIKTENVYIDVKSYKDKSFFFIGNTLTFSIDNNSKYYTDIIRDTIYECINNLNTKVVGVECPKKYINIISNRLNSFLIGTEIYDIKDSSNIVFNKEVDKKYMIDDIQKILKDMYHTIYEIEKIATVCREYLLDFLYNKNFNAWGIKSIYTSIKDISEQILKIKEWENIESYISIIEKSIKHILYCLNKNVELIKKVLVPNVIENLKTVKEALSKIYIVLYSFLKLREEFENKVKYSAKFFINTDLFNEVCTFYNNIIKFMLKVPVYENLMCGLEIKE